VSKVSRAVPVFLLFAFAVVAGAFRLRAYDLFWHLATGRWILENRAVPRIDPLRFTSESAGWIDHAWLFQLLLRFIEQVAGLNGLVFFRMSAVIALAAILLRALRRAGAPAAGAVLVAALAILGARPRLMMRPELATVIALPALLALLQWFRRTRSHRPLVGAAMLVVLWANFHPGVLVAPVVAGAFLFGCNLPGGAKPRRVGWSNVILVPALLAAAVLLNPFGWGLYQVPSRIGRALEGLPVVNPEWQRAWEAPQPALILGVVGILALVAYTFARTRRIDPATGLTTLVLAGLAVSGVRHQGLFFLGSAFLAAEALADLQKDETEPKIFFRRWGSALAAATCLLAALWCLWPPPSGPLRPRQGPYSSGLGVQPGRFPVKAVDAIRQWPEVGHLYNDVAFGGYLLWRLYPPRQVFLDGRNEVNPSLLREVALSRSDSRSWSALLERYGVDGALVRYDDRLRKVLIPGPEGEPAVTYHTTNALLFPRNRFALVYWDDLAMFFVRRTPERSDRLASEEYRYVHPEDRQVTLQAAALDPVVLERALNEINRRLAEDPGCQRALSLREDLEAMQRERI